MPIKSLVSYVVSKIPQQYVAIFVKEFNKLFKTAVANLDQVLVSIKRFKFSDLQKALKLAVSTYIGYEVVDFGVDSIKKIASDESSKYQTTEVANALHEVLVMGAKKLLSIEDAAKIYDAEVEDADGVRGVSSKDLALKHEASIVAHNAFVETQIPQVRDAAAIVKSMKHDLMRSSRILGVTEEAVIELAEILRRVNASYREVI